MTQVRRDLGVWYLQPVNQARLCDMQQTCRAKLNGVGDHVQPLTPPTWWMNVMSIVWLSSLMSPFRFCPLLRVSR